ncbi:MAG: TIGR00303 family protein [Methanoregulaceae archaeon]|nr:TIGR00303 family protein [Methanoregulaceae archaeon]
MAFLTPTPLFQVKNPIFCCILANTFLSTVPGVSGAGTTPETTLFTPILDAELIFQGAITSMKVRPNTPTGCPTPASITRAMMTLTGLSPLFINAGLVHRPTVPCLDLYGEPGGDPRTDQAVPRSKDLYIKGEWIGRLFSRYTELLVLGECVPGGTTTALCLLRALGYPASVSSSYVKNPVTIKEDISRSVLARIGADRVIEPLELVRYAGDPMMPVAAGIASTFSGILVLAGGTQMLAVAALQKILGLKVPSIATTCYVRDDESANFKELAAMIGATVYYVDPEFGEIGHSGLARYCIGEVKEGMGAGGAMFLAHLLGHSSGDIKDEILAMVRAYS